MNSLYINNRLIEQWNLKKARFYMNIRHLRIFVAVNETGSTTAAGKKLHIAQPSVSLAISELEDYYGIKLFDRISNKLQITEAGKYFLQYASHIVGLFDDMEKEVKNMDKIGIIRVGASVTIGSYLLPKYITEFKKKHENMDVRVKINNTDRIQQYVLSNQVDIGLIEGKVNNADIITKAFRVDELVEICAKKHPFAGRDDVNVDELKSQSLILRESGSAVRDVIDRNMSLHGLEMEPAWESTSTEGIIRAVKAGLGVSALPELIVKDWIKKGAVSRFKVKGIELKRKFSLIHHRNKYLSRSAKDFISICK